MKKLIFKKKLILGILLFPCLVFSQDFKEKKLTLELFLQEVQKNNRHLVALQSSQRAANLRYVQTDLELSPAVTLKASQLDDKALVQAGSFTQTRLKATEYSLGLGKKFSTGTSVALSGSATESNLEALTPGPFSLRNARGSMGISLSQSLWKDGFGSATNLKYQREEQQRNLEFSSYDLQIRKALSEAESAYWDLIYSKFEVQLRKESLQRAKKIESWISRRVGNGIGDRADLLNAQGLVATRELQLISAEDQLISAKVKVANLMELSDVKNLPEVEENLNEKRELLRLVDSLDGQQNQSEEILRLDAYLSVIESKTKAISAQEVSDQFKPDLSLEGQYKTNGYSDSMQSISPELDARDRPTTAIAIKFTYLLDEGVKKSARNAARLDAVASQDKAMYQVRDGRTAWQEMLRRNSELSNLILQAEKIARIQSEKAVVERDKLSKGRSITSNVITAEQDAAESELSMSRLKVEQRKLESQARLFVKIPTSKIESQESSL